MTARLRVNLLFWAFLAPLLWTSQVYAVCSGFLGDVVINEVYDGPGFAFVETKLLDNGLSLLLSGGWTIRICHRQGNTDVCLDYSFGDGEWVEAFFGNPYFMFFPSNQTMDLNGMDITVRDSADRVIDYLSINGYEHQKSACSAVPDNSVDLGSGIKGAQRLPDGTGNWNPFEKSGATDETTPNNPNKGTTAQIDHYEIIHDGSALTCAPEQVTVRACADDADPCTPYTEEVDITLWVDGIAAASQTINGGSGSIRLRHTIAETVFLSVTGEPAAEQAQQCVNSGGGDPCELTFYETGFLFELPDLEACQTSSIVNIRAVRMDDYSQACTGVDGFVGTRGITMTSSYGSDKTGTVPVLVRGDEDTDYSELKPTATVQVSFDESATGSFIFSYADAGSVTLTASFSGSGDELGLKMLGADPFVAFPHHLQVSATYTNPVTGLPVTLNNDANSGTPHWPAGAGFNLEVAGVCANGDPTLSFRWGTDLNVLDFEPEDGRAGGFAPASLVADAYSGGVSKATVSYSEVGTLTLQAVVANYLEPGINVTGTAAIGRFTPARFALSLYQSPELTPACSSGRFTYVGQTFGYAAAPVVKITALNQLGDVTENYTQDGWWKITEEELLAGHSYSAAKGSFELSGGGANYAYPVDGAGSGTLTFDEDSAMKFVRGPPVAPFYADIDLKINVVDADGISATAPLSITDIPFTGEDKDNGVNTDEMRWGRLALQNAYGSERVNLPMPFRAEYFNGSAFATNAQDGCTGLASTILQLTDKNDNDYSVGDPIPVGTAGTSTATMNATFASGEGGLEFSAPNSEGYIDVRADLSLLPWLLYDWKGVGPEGPTARATFGIYKSRPGIIYRRETYR
jgi:MSHA biogenesis protein MshQ